jgi:cytochrome oxidase assembly protein ShyY1
MSKQSTQNQIINADSIKQLLINMNWIIFTFLIIVAFLISVRLGLWQFDRHEARVASNQAIENALSQEILPINQILKDQVTNWQKVSVIGEFETTSQQLVRRRYLEGNLGFWVVAKLNTPDGGSVLINRGFTPVTAAANKTPDIDAPPSGTLEITGYLHKLDAESLRPADLPDGQVNSINATQFNLSENDYQFFIHEINLQSDLSSINPPTLGYGSHLAYALQWMAFAFMIIIGWLILTRKELTEQKKSST